MLAFALAGFGAGRLDCRVDDLGMTLGWNLCLCNENLVTDGAMLTLGLAGCGAGSCNSFVDHLGMALGGDFFHTGENRLTNGALRTRLVAGLGAGGRLLRHVNDGVAGGSDCFGLGCIANCAGVGLDTDVQTGRRGRNHAFVPAVALGLNGFTLGDLLAADGADRITGVAGLGAGGVLLVDHLERMFVLPAGLESQIGKSKQFWLCPRPIIEFFLVVPEAHLDRAGNQPAIEGVTLASKATFGKRVILAGRAVDDLYRIHRAFAAVGVKGDGQLFKLAVLRREINVLMRIEAPAVDSFRIIIGGPAIPELIGVVFILRSCGFRVTLPSIVICVFLTGIPTFL